MVEGSYHDLPRQLLTACECGDLESVQQILDSEDAAVEVDCDGGEGFTPLHIATANGHENIVRLLLMRGASLDVQNTYGWTPLMQASFHGHLNIVALLLQNKASPVVRNKMGASALTLAAYQGHSQVVSIFLDLAWLDLGPGDTKGDGAGQFLPPTVAAIIHGHDQILKQLIDRGSDQFYKDPGTGWSLLMVAALSGYSSAVQLLLDSDCDPNTSNINNCTALDIAALSKHKKARELLEKKTTNRPITSTDNSESKIIEATEQGDLKTVQRMLDEDPMRSNHTSVDGATPLMIAAMLGRRDLAEILVQRGAEVNRQDAKSGWTALMQATFHRHKDVVKYLIQAGADLNLQARDGCKALDLALVIISDETDKVGNELIRLLAPVTMPTTNGQPSVQSKPQANSTMWTTRIASIDQMEEEDEAKRSGLKAWWSRMSNRFRNLKLTRTLRGGFSSTKLTPFEDETARPDETLRSIGSSQNVKGEQPLPIREVSSKHQRRKSKEGSRVSFGKIEKESIFEPVQTLDIDSPRAKTSDKLLPVIPPFLPPPTFDLHNADKSRKSHSKGKGMGTGRKNATNSANTTTTTATVRTHRPMFARRPGSTGISPSNSAHFSTTISPNSSGDTLALTRGLLSSQRYSLPGPAPLGLTGSARVPPSAQSGVLTRTGDAYGSNSEDQGGVAAVKKRHMSTSSIPSLAQIPSSPQTRHGTEAISSSNSTSSSSRRHSAHPTHPASLGSNSSLPHPKARSHSGSASTKGSTSSTLTPSPSPTPLGRGNQRRTSGGGGSEDGGRGGGGLQGLQGSSRLASAGGSSSISEEDELSNLLRKLSLEKYAPIFEEQEVDMEAFLALNDSDLKEMGIRHKEPRSQILTAITQINTGKNHQAPAAFANHSPSMGRYAFPI